MSQDYAIFDENGKIKYVTRYHNELVEIMTGMYKDGYSFSAIDRNQAGRLKKELQTKNDYLTKIHN